ncbi:DUF3300 domain-containing protein [Thalassotalea piscium]
MKSFLQKINMNKLLISIMLLIISASSYAYEEQERQFSEAELAQMLAPIALYPDALLTHVLIASTYPLEVVEAERWLSKRESLTKKQIISQSEGLDWDASVIALLPFPSIVKKLNEDLTWMQNLGDAFLQDEEQLIATIQVLRQQAEASGNLDKMDNVQVVREKTTIIIEPAEPEVVYVPYYDTRVVYGRWHWERNPPVFWNRPHYYGYNRGPFYWNTGIHIGFNFFFGDIHWDNRHVIVDYSRPRKYHSRIRVSTSSHAKRWHHEPVHRKGVAYRSTHLKQKYSSSRPVASHQSKSRSSRTVTLANSHDRHSQVVKVNKHNNEYRSSVKQSKMREKQSQSFKQKLQKPVVVNKIKAPSKNKYSYDDRNQASRSKNKTSYQTKEVSKVKTKTVKNTTTYQTKQVKVKNNSEMKTQKSYNKTRAQPQSKPVNTSRQRIGRNNDKSHQKSKH